MPPNAQPGTARPPARLQPPGTDTPQAVPADKRCQRSSRQGAAPACRAAHRAPRGGRGADGSSTESRELHRADPRRVRENRFRTWPASSHLWERKAETDIAEGLNGARPGPERKERSRTHRHSTDAAAAPVPPGAARRSRRSRHGRRRCSAARNCGHRVNPLCAGRGEAVRRGGVSGGCGRNLRWWAVR